MKILAEYVMAGPKQASIFCVIFGLVPVIGPWLSSAALALVVLRAGFNQSLKVLPWAVLPALVWAVIGDFSFLSILSSVYVAAIVLENSRSLSLALVVTVSVSAIGFVASQKLMPESLEQLNKVTMKALDNSPEFDQLLDQTATSSAESGGKQDSGLSSEINEDNSNTLSAQTATEVSKESNSSKNKKQALVIMLTAMAFAWAGGLTACLVLLLARWWQSLLYKPGAFQQEFHRLKLSGSEVLILLVLISLCVQGFGQQEMQGLSGTFALGNKLGMVIVPVFTIPMLLSGIALVHGLVAIAGMSVHWLGMFYMSLLFMGQLLYLPLVVTSLIDVFVNFRERLRKFKSQNER